MLPQSSANFESSLGMLWNFSLGYLDFFFWPVFLTLYASTWWLFFFLVFFFPHSDLAVEIPVMCMSEVENLNRGPKYIHKQIHAYINIGPPHRNWPKTPIIWLDEVCGKGDFKISLTAANIHQITATVLKWCIFLELQKQCTVFCIDHWPVCA